MKTQIMYIEHKTNQNDRGEAWIGRVEFSKTGQTIYFNKQALKKSGSQGIYGNFYDLETGEEYWVSGVKKDGQDRHWSGAGKIKIDRSVTQEYLSLVDFEELDKSNFEIIDIPQTDKSRFNKMENTSYRESE